MAGAGRLKGIFALATGFAIGQGAMFLAQTWLILSGELDIVGRVGLALAGLSLAQVIADCGGTFLLARHAAQGRGREYLASANLVRFAVGLAATTILLVVALLAADPVERAVLLGGVASVIIWSLNLAGLLDGIGRTQSSGPIGSLSWFFAACGLALFDISQPVRSGILVGGLFSIGTAVSVILQYRIAHRAGYTLASLRISAVLVREFAREAGYYTFANVPAQMYGRGLILLAKTFLGAEVAGGVVYARNLITAAMQGITFIRRVEFPALARHSAEAGYSLRTAFRHQWWSIAGSFVFLSLIGGVLLLAPGALGGKSGSVALALICLSLPVPLWACSSAFGQVALAVGNTRIYAAVINGSIAVGVGVILASIRGAGIFALLWGESAMYSVQILAYLIYQRVVIMRVGEVGLQRAAQ